MGTKKAAVAIAHKILVATFHMLQRATAFADLGADYLDRVDKHRTAKRLVCRLDALGYAVMLRPKPAMAYQHTEPGPPPWISGPAPPNTPNRQGHVG